MRKTKQNEPTASADAMLAADAVDMYDALDMYLACLDGLIYEFVRLVEGYWAHRGTEDMVGRRTLELHDILTRAVALEQGAFRSEYIRGRAALEADGAQEARRVAGGCGGAAQGEDGDAGDDGDAAVVGAESETAEGVTEACFCVEFAFRQFLDLVLSFGKPVFEGGNFGFECIDAPTAKKRADALHGLVARIKEFRNGDDFGKLHDAVIAHAAMRG